MNTLSDIIGAIIGYGLVIGFIVLCIGAFSAMLGLAFPGKEGGGGQTGPRARNRRSVNLHNTVDYILRSKWTLFVVVVLTVVAWLFRLGCFDKKVPAVNYYYLVIEDCVTGNRQNFYTELFEAKTDSDAVLQALLSAGAGAAFEGQMASQFPTAEMKRHQYLINVFSEEGLVRPLDAKLMQDYIWRWASRSSLWQKNDDMKAALEFYKENTNIFKEPERMFELGDLYAKENALKYGPFEKIEHRKKEDSAKENSLLKRFLTIWLVLWTFPVVLYVNWFITDMKERRVNRRTAKMIVCTEPQYMMLNRPGDPKNDICEFDMATVRHYASFYYNEGMFSGWIVPGRPATVYNSYGRVVGCLSDHDSDSFRVWCASQPLPFVGYIYKFNHKLYGKLRAVRPCNETFLRDSICDCFRWVNAALGDEYNLPSAISWVMPDD